VRQAISPESSKKNTRNSTNNSETRERQASSPESSNKYSRNSTKFSEARERQAISPESSKENDWSLIPTDVGQ